MSRFRVGDVCVGQGFGEHLECNGMECVVLEVVDHTHWLVDYDGAKELVDISYEVRWADGEVDNQPHRRLRLRRPPSWDQWLYDTKDVEREGSEPTRERVTL